MARIQPASAEARSKARAYDIVREYLLSHYRNEEDVEIVLTDILTDLLHYTAAADLNPERVLDLARSHFNAERTTRGINEPA